VIVLVHLVPHVRLHAKPRDYAVTTPRLQPNGRGVNAPKPGGGDLRLAEARLYLVDDGDERRTGLRAG